MSAFVMSDEQKRRRRSKNLALGLAIAALCALFYVITIIRMGGQ